MATHSSILAWRIPRTKKPGGLQSMELQRVRHDWVTNTFTFHFLDQWWDETKFHSVMKRKANNGHGFGRGGPGPPLCPACPLWPAPTLVASSTLSRRASSSASYCSFSLSISRSWLETSSFRAPFSAVSSRSRFLKRSSCSSLAMSRCWRSCFACRSSCREHTSREVRIQAFCWAALRLHLGPRTHGHTLTRPPYSLSRTLHTGWAPILSFSSPSHKPPYPLIPLS